MILRGTAALILLVLLTGCGQQHQPAGQPTPGVGTKTFVVTGVTVDGAPRALAKGSQIRLAFSGRRLTLTAGCNTMSGQYTLDGTRLIVSALSSTEMGCAQGLMDQDTWLAGLFAKPVQFTDGGSGAVISGRTVLAITERSNISPDRPLVGTTWLLETVYAEQMAGSVPHGLVAWVVFHADGTVRISDGLNEASGAVRVAGDRVTFGDLAWTAVGCIRPATCSVGAVARVLSGTVTFAITEQHLTLTHGREGLGFRAVDRLPAHD